MHKYIKFTKIKRVILFGGSNLLADAAVNLSKGKKYGVVVFSSPRHLNGVIKENITLRDILIKNKVTFFSERNINTSKRVQRFIDNNTLGIAMGAPWLFSKHFVKLFRNPLLDFMGIDLPKYRGGAHYTWKILFADKNGCCNLQVISGSEDTFHKGAIIKRKSYRLANTFRLPADYFRKAVSVEMEFLLDFLKEASMGKEFMMHPLDESKSTYLPFLHTMSNGWIDWTWSAPEIERFICAFDDPYDGASTRVNGRRVFLKKASILHIDEKIHPVSAGLIIFKTDRFIKIFAKGGILKIEQVLDRRKKNIIKRIDLGGRFISYRDDIDRALSFHAKYTPDGLKK